jgi:ribosomal protein L21E
VFTATAICNFGDKSQWEKSKVSQPITVYGIGKYSHLTIDGSVHHFNFGDVYVGKSAERKFILMNNSAVVSNFKIEQAERDTDPYFMFSTMSGSIGSKKRMEISVHMDICAVLTIF